MKMLESPKKDEIRIAQLTDCHLLKDEKAFLKGFNTNKTFLECLTFAKTLKPDYFLLTGDISEDGSVESYERIFNYLNSTNIKYMLLPGNHDNIENMQAVFKDDCFLNQKVSINNWNLILLNTKFDSEVYGKLSSLGLNTLIETLNIEDLPVGIFLHHPPLKINSPLMDQYALKNPETLLEVCMSNKGKVKFLSFGHVHQDFTSDIEGIKFFASPSTCMQFKPKMTKLEFDDKAAGIRMFTLFKDGAFTTQVFRI